MVRDEPIAPVLADLVSRQAHGALAIGRLAAQVGGVPVQRVMQGGTLRRMLPFLR